MANTAKYLLVTKYGTLSLRKSTVWDDTVTNTVDRQTKLLYTVRFKLTSEALEEAKKLGLSQREALKENPNLLVRDGTGLGRFVSNGTEKITTYYRGDSLDSATIIFENVKKSLLRGVKPTKKDALKTRVRSVQPASTGITPNQVVVSLPIPVNSGEGHKIRSTSMRKGLSKKEREAYYVSTQEKSVPTFNPLVSKKFAVSIR